MAEIQGLRHVLETLKEIDPKLYRQGQSRIKKDVKPLVDDARGRVPSQTPLRNWKESTSSGVTRSGAARLPAWEANAPRRITTRVRREKVRGMGGRRILIRVVQASPSGAVFDMAGRKNSGSTFARNLTSKYGAASRSMWPAAEARLGDIRGSVEESVRAMEREINAILAKNPRVP